MNNKVFYDLELEKTQSRMLNSVKHGKDVQVYEFLCFLGSFHQYLTIPRKVYGDWKTPGYSAAKPWLVVLSKYAKLVGIPKDMVGHLQTCVRTKDVHLLDWVITQTMDSLRSLVKTLTK